MQDRPSIHELLDIVQNFLDEKVVTSTSGRTQFLVRVAANCLRMVDRELEGEDVRFAALWSGLDGFLPPGTPPGSRREREQAVGLRLEALCEKIRAGQFEEGSPEQARLLGFLRDSVRGKLEVANPKLLAADRERGID